MARHFKINEKHLETLELLSKGLTQEQVSKELKEPPSATSYRVAKLIHEGYLKLEGRSAIKTLSPTSKANVLIYRGVSETEPKVRTSNHNYGIFTTPTAQPALLASLPAPATTTQQPASQQASKAPIPKLRLHALELGFPLLNSLGKDEPIKVLMNSGITFKQGGLKNHKSAGFTYDGFRGYLTTKTMIVYSPQIELAIEASISELITEALNLVEPFAIKMEARTGLKLRRIDKDTLIADILQSHIALKDHSVAEYIIATGNKLEVRDRITGDIRVLVDFSNEHYEYEAVNKQHAIPDASRLARLTEKVIYGEFDPDKIDERIEKLLKGEELSLEFKASHIAMIDAITGYFNIKSNKIKKQASKLQAEKEESKRQKRL